VKVLYVSGWCRSGSTVLGNLLGELDGVVHVGELFYLWRNGVLGAGTNTSCGCGAPVRDCPLWSAVLASVVGDDPVADAHAAMDDQRRRLRTRHTAARLAEALGHRATPPEVEAIRDRMVSLYRAIGKHAGARLIVDSGKYPAEPATLLGRDDVDLRVLHLIRDPRATAHSWRRAKAYIPAMGVARSTAYWTGANIATERIGAAAPDRYLRLRYEDFTADPRAHLADVLRLCGLDDEPPVGHNGDASLGVNHTVTGNPDRLTHGPIRIRPDDAWRTGLPAVPALTTTALALPRLRRYGYTYTR
jgi:hypothetical protein